MFIPIWSRKSVALPRFSSHWDRLRVVHFRMFQQFLGCLDRFMAYLIEETKGKFPTWLAPVQVKVLPVSEKTLEYAESITEKLVEAGVRVALDDDNQKIGYKIREARISFEFSKYFFFCW